MSAQKSSNFFHIILALLALIATTLACAEKTFADLHVYSDSPGAVEQFYDRAADKILKENVWVFHPDGSYSANVEVDGESLILSGKYGGDDAGDEFLFSIDTDNDGNYDETFFVGDDFSLIEWRRESGTLKYFLAK